MKRTNTWQDAFNTGEVALDLGDGLTTRIPTGNSATRITALETAKVTVDNTVGRRAFAWDATNNRAQMIYGDTGLRNISTLLVERTAGTIYIVRYGNTVELTFIDVVLGTLSGMVEVSLVPTGFKPPTWRHFSSSPHADDTPNGMVIKASDVLRIYGLSSGELIQGTLTYYTAQAWPTELPGTAVGSIPT